MNNLLWLTQVIITLAKNDMKKTTKTAELAVLGSNVSLKLCVL